MPRRLTVSKAKQEAIERRKAGNLSYRDFRYEQWLSKRKVYETLYKRWGSDAFMREVFANLYTLRELTKTPNEELRAIIIEWVGDSPAENETREGLLCIVINAQIKEVRHQLNERLKHVEYQQDKYN